MARSGGAAAVRDAAREVGDLPECVWCQVGRYGRLRFPVSVTVGPASDSRTCASLKEAVQTRERLRADLRAAWPRACQAPWRVRLRLLADGTERWVADINTPNGRRVRTFETDHEAQAWTVEIAREFGLREAPVERLWSGPTNSRPSAAGADKSQTVSDGAVAAPADRVSGRRQIVRVWEMRS